MVERACRYFGQSAEYWEDHMTGRRLKAQAKEMRLSPPSEFFLAIYFRAHDWWHPAGADDVVIDQSAAEELESIPEYEP